MKKKQYRFEFIMWNQKYNRNPNKNAKKEQKNENGKETKVHNKREEKVKMDLHGSSLEKPKRKNENVCIGFAPSFGHSNLGKWINPYTWTSPKMTKIGPNVSNLTKSPKKRIYTN